MGQTLRVCSYNVRDFKDDPDAAARVVRCISPDLLCLQEVPRHLLSSRRIARFANACGLSWSGGHRGSGGTTVMSSLQVELGDVRHSRLPVPPLQRERGYAVCRVRLPGYQDVSLVSVHLSLDPRERAEHAAAVLAALPGDVPLILAGDLNEGPDGLAWQVIAERLSVVSPDVLTYPAGSPRSRLDVIFASAMLPPVAREPIELDLADLVAATDHRPVWVNVDLSRAILT